VLLDAQPLRRPESTTDPYVWMYDNSDVPSYFVPAFVYVPGVSNSADTLRVVLADDHHFFREGLRGMLAEDGITVVGEAADGDGAVALTRELSPDVVVIDLEMPGISGIDALRHILASSPETQVLVLTVSAEEADVLAALSAGACGYLLKDARPDHLVGGIRLVAGGHAVLSREVARALAAEVQSSTHSEEVQTGDSVALTARELEVIRLIADGADNAAIGLELSISRHTVKQYVTNILEKTETQSRVQAAVYAVRTGIV
jgi:two-component system nitrate/nitrite response regulator NarL